ncbi:MAG: hypothetical protein WC565_08010 [Parcubacteria group bacterium]
MAHTSNPEASYISARVIRWLEAQGYEIEPAALAASRSDGYAHPALYPRLRAAVEAVEPEVLADIES